MLLLVIAVIEGIALMFGGPLSDLIEGVLPDPWDSLDGPFDKVLGWLHLGRVPVLALPATIGPSPEQ